MNTQSKKDWFCFGLLVIVAILLLWWTEQSSVERDFSLSFDNLDYGEPADSDFVTNRLGYALGFVKAWKQPSWVAYRLTPEEASAKRYDRTNNFMDDYGIPGGSATLADYRQSGYDRGHLAPAGDMTWDAVAMIESFYMSNMSPQKPAFNRGIWCDLEKHLRHFAASGKTLFIFTGPIFELCSHTNGIGRSNVLVPSAFYKAVYCETPPESMIAFVIPNIGTNVPLSVFAITIDELENITGMNFFNTLPKKKQEELESKIELKRWLLREEPSATQP